MYLPIAKIYSKLCHWWQEKRSLNQNFINNFLSAKNTEPAHNGTYTYMQCIQYYKIQLQQSHETSERRTLVNRMTSKINKCQWRRSDIATMLNLWHHLAQAAHVLWVKSRAKSTTKTTKAITRANANLFNGKKKIKKRTPRDIEKHTHIPTYKHTEGRRNTAQCTACHVNCHANLQQRATSMNDRP